MNANHNGSVAKLPTYTVFTAEDFFGTKDVVLTTTSQTTANDLFATLKATGRYPVVGLNVR